jgi:hypothetical protein
MKLKELGFYVYYGIAATTYGLNSDFTDLTRLEFPEAQPKIVYMTINSSASAATFNFTTGSVGL